MQPDVFFAGAGLDRADAARADAELLSSYARSPLAAELVWADGLPAVSQGGDLLWQPVGDGALFLGLDGDRPRFSPLQATVGGWPAVMPLVGCLSPAQAPIFAAAMSLARWHSTHGFCANCGAPSDLVRGGWSRRCGTCGTEHYPRVDPVAIMLVEHDGRLLLGRSHYYSPGRYSALAGFVEVGESLEDAVAREVLEEAGVVVTDVAYVASQPWPFPSSLMIGCRASALDDRLTIDRTELDDARWFTRAEVAAAVAGADEAPFGPPPPFAIARSLLEHWLTA
ncbi:NAD(+) diphosphatase [Sphingomonas sabuli]|uniref:NAD(+) diphosphatase n=1 Tax=Sphingomonas sabuli TaxID=2764186 RepID=A0A7G9L5E6_9SPHN|nr:NAD(+) diphosphatase [Sphingomonas sabuli]QNM83845.1 NAD(+) diphosphatase [Sphingomonas sabuli]